MLMTERIQQKLTTIAKIAQVYCRACHAKRTGLCEECAELLDYVSLRLSHCPFLPDRQVCAKCLAHCYKADKREKIHRGDALRRAAHDLCRPCGGDKTPDQPAFETQSGRPAGDETPRTSTENRG